MDRADFRLVITDVKCDTFTQSNKARKLAHVLWESKIFFFFI